VERSDVRFAWNEDVAIAFQLIGAGQIDLLYLPAFLSNLDWQWEYPRHARFLERLASFTRVIAVDRRGWGCSDRVTPGTFPPLEVAADDLIAVLDAAGSKQAAIFGGAEAGWVASIAAATHPDRFSALILYQAAATWAKTNETPWNLSPSQWEAQEPYWLSAGTVVFYEDWIRKNEPSLAGEPGAAEYLARLSRGTIGIGGGLAEFRRYNSTDIRAILPAIRVPTLVLNRPANTTERPENGRFLASKLPDARLVELPGADYMPWAGESEALLDEIEEFLTGSKHVAEIDRILATVLFTDVVGSTEKAVELGDRGWRALLEEHNLRIRNQLDRFRGREIDTTGDGFLATFDGPARAVRCAQAIGAALRGLGIEIRAGCHTGEVELVEDGVGGIAVHIGARVSALAEAGEIFVSSTVKDLVVGSDLTFEDAGVHELKGVPGRWQLYSVVNEGA
jgi:class 3 adenylate cyclase